VRRAEEIDPAVAACSLALEQRPWYERRREDVRRWRVVYKEAYLKPRPTEVGVKLFFDYLDRLPSYEECGPQVRGDRPVHSIKSKYCEAAMAHGVYQLEKGSEGRFNLAA
jgi:hypothetical protein